MARNKTKKRSKSTSGFQKKTGDSFLQKNKVKPGVFEKESGLQYSIITDGEGDSPKEGDNVTVNQRILLVDGKVISDTYKTGEPAEFDLDDYVLEGYLEGLLMMKEGSRFKFFIPPELAWGDKGSSTRIPPNAVIVIDVKLISFY